MYEEKGNRIKVRFRTFLCFFILQKERRIIMFIVSRFFNIKIIFMFTTLLNCRFITKEFDVCFLRCFKSYTAKGSITSTNT